MSLVGAAVVLAVVLVAGACLLWQFVRDREWELPGDDRIESTLFSFRKANRR